jgi:hypothetical protein
VVIEFVWNPAAGFHLRRMVNPIGYARYGSTNLSSDGGSKLGFGPPSLPNNRVESNGQRRFIGGWLCASLAKEGGVDERRR